jgi:hypothetical protein
MRIVKEAVLDVKKMCEAVDCDYLCYECEQVA